MPLQPLEDENDTVISFLYPLEPPIVIIIDSLMGTRIGDTLDFEIKRWSTGKQGNLRALLSTLQYIRPSDKKVDYQIQKLTNAADNATAREKSGNAEVNGKDGHSDEEDLLKYRPNPDMMDTDWFSWSGVDKIF
ncbi:Auxilin-related protein 1 [Zea mays]|uniref:Auxilin-related protein 1 n=1 Tax=Zea mays TaxID=4577 RepID=A0A317YCP0_MAIZE|nr:Auxilin-related protein 1 [Zea mays]